MNEVAQVWEKNLLIIGSEIWYMFDFSRNIVVIIVQSGLKLYNFTILAAGVETEQVCNLFAQRRAIPFYIHTPPMEEVSQNLPLRNQRSNVPTRAPLQKLPKFSFPLRKKPIFFQTPTEIFKRSKAPTQQPPQK